MKKIALSNGGYVLVDDADWLELRKYTWRGLKHRNGIYAARAELPIGKRRKVLVYMHRQIMGATKGQIVDHTNRNKLDCTRGNLRLTTVSRNAQNAVMNMPNKTSRYRGVYRRGKKWGARLRALGRNFSLGTFSTELDAAIAYDTAARKHFGANCFTNFGDKKP